MKRLKKLPWFIALAGLIIFAMTSCSHEVKDENDAVALAAKIPTSGEYPYFGKKVLTIKDQQVWTRNRYATKISQVYLKYNGTHDIDVAATVVNPMFDPANPVPGEPPYQSFIIGAGTIRNGILDFEVNNLIENDHLLKWSDFKLIFSRYWKNVVFSSNTSIMGNMFLLWAYPVNAGVVSPDPDGMLDRQGMFGTAATITCETILYIYVNEDCIISGEANEGYIEKQYYYSTEGNLNLPLKAGWNLVCRRETYGTNFNGRAIIGMSVKNPIPSPENYKWVMELGFSL